MICALLIFQTPELPAPLQELSMWVDSDNSEHGVLAQLEAQQHRRFMKTHRRLGEVTLDPRATYIVIARRPLDVALSFYHHLKSEQERRLPPGVQFPSLDDMLGFWMDEEIAPVTIPDDFLMTFMMAHLRDSWARRDEPNVVLMHYDDLLTDLAGQMRALAARIGITIPEATWPQLVQAATFHDMRANADRIQPLPTLQDPKSFFHSGTSGRGRQHLTDSQLAHYHDLAARLAPPDLLAWVNREDSAR
jgi:aryl sulfotransferase